MNGTIFSATKLRYISGFSKRLLSKELWWLSPEEASFPTSVQLQGLWRAYEQEKISMPNWIAELMKDLNTPECFSMEVNEILRKYSYNYSYACRCFKKYTGTNIVNFFLASKMNFALSLLQFSNKSITEISILSGFSSINYFNRIFKKTYGISPSQYRKSTF